MEGNKLRIDELKISQFNFEDACNIKDVSNNDIAIIGISTRFPMAEDIEEFWENINNKIDCVDSLPEDRKSDIDKYMSYNGATDDNFKYLRGAYINEIDKFDYSFFNLTPNDAKLTDPKQRIFLEIVWNAIEDAGYSEKMISGSNVGIYVGNIGDLDGYKYKQMIYDVDPNLIPFSLAGTLSSIMPSRISYLLNLKGPSIMIDTACSSSLVAVDIACQALRNGVCDMAVVGSARLNLLPFDKECFKVGIESSDYLTRTFDQGADGSGMGEGAAAILIKPLSKAKRDGDNIYAVIKGSAVNQDGRSFGITAPNPSAQTDVIIKAWENSGIDPRNISYIDTHGTATKLGDPIEIEGITNAFKRYTDKKQFCAVSSVKSNIGHTYECAGLAGLIKAVLALKYKIIPPSTNFNRPNNKIDFNNSPVYVNTKPRKWEAGKSARLCGVSSFGLSGTNCHIVLEEYTNGSSNQYEYTERKKEKLDVLTLSAKSIDSLKKLVEKYKRFSVEVTEESLENLCYTANTGRGQYSYRLVIIIKDISDFKEKIDGISISQIEKLNGPSVYFGKCKAIPNDKKHLKIGEVRENDLNKLNKIAKEKLIEFEKTSKSNLEVLQEICKLFTAGATINWESFYLYRKFNKISLPVYPFERNRCWLDIHNNKEENNKDLYYTMQWKRDGLVNCKTISCEGTVMVLGDWHELIQKMKACGRDVIEVRLGTRYTKIDPNKFVISGSYEDYKQLVNDIKSRDLKQIIHSFTIGTKENITMLDELEVSLNKGIYSLAYLTKAIYESEIRDMIDVVLISEYVNNVTGEEEFIFPENASMFGLGKALSKEYDNISYRCIDIDRYTDTSEVISCINSERNVYQIALRNGIIYSEIFSKINCNTITDEKMEIRENGVYLITGGTGGIGIEVARYIASINKVRLVLVSRSGIPKREKWEEIINLGTDKRLIEKINAIKEIEALGSKVIVYSVDVSDMDKMEKMLRDVRGKYGSINGVIHGAGNIVNKALIDEEKGEFKEVIAPKIQGTLVLDMLTRDDNPDFFVLFSSIATIFNTINQSDYIAANSYMDSYSSYRNMKFGRTLSIDWATWREKGLAADQKFNIDTLFKALSTETALNGLKYMLDKKDITRVLIGEINYDSKIVFLLDTYGFTISNEIYTKIKQLKKDIKNNRNNLNESFNSKVKLIGKENEEYTEIEKEIAQICKDTLGFEEIDVNETFFELGADSISMKRIYQCLEKKFPEEILISDLFEYPTISKLSKCIIDNRNKVDSFQGELENGSVDAKDIDKELNSIFDNMQNGNLTVEEVVNNLSNI